LPGIRFHADRLAGEAQRAKATYLGFLADTLSRTDKTHLLTALSPATAGWTCY
jgi:hypothetical protein